MADTKLDAGFEEVPLDEGFEEVAVEPASEAPAEPAPAEESDGVRTAKDFGLGAAQGASLGLADELTAAAQAAGEVATTDKSLSDLQDLYSQFQKIEQNRYREAEERSPWAYGGGRFAGSIAPGLGAAGAAARVIKPASVLSKMGAGMLSGGIAGGVEGVASSESPIIGGTELDRERALSAGKSGAILGSVLGGALETTTGKAVGTLAAAKQGAEAIGEAYPFVRQTYKAAKEGLEGKLLNTQAAKEASYLADEKIAKELGEQVIGGSDILGEQVGDVLVDASRKGVRVKAGPELEDSINSIKRLVDTNEVVRLDPKAQRVKAYLEKISKNDLDPVEARDLVAKVRELGAESDNPAFKRVLDDAAMKFRNTLGQQVPGYNETAGAFNQFSKAAPELLAGKQISASDPVKFAESVKDQLKSFVQSVGAPGTSKGQTVTEFRQFIESLKKLKETNPEAYLKSQMPAPESLEALIRGQGDVSSMMRQINRVDPQGFLGTSRALAMEGANLAGYAAGKVGEGAKAIGEAVTQNIPKALSEPATSAVNIGKRLYDASDDALQAVATKLSGVKELAPKGEALAKAIATKNRAQRNAILFSILQSPAARGILAEDQ